MDAEQKLIIGLGDLFKTSAHVDALMPAAIGSNHAAVRICSSKSQENLTDSIFLGQPHCIDMRRQLLKQLLPFLNRSDAFDQKTPFSGFDVSRRFARLLFSQHQDWVWSSIVSSLREANVEAHNIVILIDMADSFASAVWIDCLFGLKARYPQASFYPVFLLPQMENLAVEEAAVIGAAVTELSQLSQGRWTPTDINTGEDYPCGEPLWAVAYLQQCPQVQNDTTFLQLVDAVLTLSNVGHNDYGTLRQTLTQEYQKILKPSNAKSAKILPRFASMLQASLDFDVEALEGLLIEQCESKLLASLTNTVAPEQTQNLDIATMTALGCVLTHTQLTLDEDSCGEHIGVWSELDMDWQQHSATLLQQNLSGNWLEQAEHIASQLRAVYDKQFRKMGAEKYYEASEMRLNQMAQNHVAYVETQLWHAWQQGRSSLSDLQAAVEGIIIHYVQWHQDFLARQENNIDAIKANATWWENLSGQWQSADKKERALLTKEYSLETVAEHMSRLFIERCQYKAHVFAEKMILAMQPYLLDLQQDLHNASEAWLVQATHIQKTLNQTIENQQANWLKQVIQAMHCRYLLQPNKASLQSLVNHTRNAARLVAPELNADCVNKLAKQNGFAALIEYIQAGSWKESVRVAATKASKSILANEPALLAEILEQRITELDQQQVQYLGKYALSNLSKQFRKLIQPLGKVLTTQYAVNESACLACAEHIQQHELVTSWLAHSAQQSLPKAKVIALNGVNGAQFIYASTCYLDEWVDLPEFLQAYRQFNHSDEALLHLHIDGSNAAISVMQKNSINRNRELIRQHLLLAHASGRLVQEAGHYQLQVSEKSKALDFHTEQLADVVDVIALDDVQKLVDVHEHMQNEKVFIKEAAQIGDQLEEVLAQIKRESLPDGIDLEEADWADAGRYVVWSRAAQHLRKQWLKEAGGRRSQKVA